MLGQGSDDPAVVKLREPAPVLAARPAVGSGPVARRLRFRSRGWPLASGLVLGVFVFCGTFGPLIAPHNPNQVNLSIALRGPGWVNGGSWSYPLGTDELGRDVLSRLLSGARVSMLVALAAVLISGVIGLAVAMIGGYLGGRLDAVLTRITDTSLAFPFMLLAIAIIATFGASLKSVIAVLVLAGWPQYARVLRSEVLKIRHQDYVLMSKVMDAPTRWILKRHVLPNIVGTLLVLATLQVGMAIIVEGSLSFLGIGIPPPAASWGNMLSEGRSYVSSAWWIAVFPGVCLSLTVLSANLMGDWLQAHFDPTRR
jgi:peptide/nickel transport system permease protein